MSHTVTHHERALVGLAILEPAKFDQMEIDLSCHVFTDDICSVLWPLLARLRRDGCQMDVRTLTRELIVQDMDSRVPYDELQKLALRDAGLGHNVAYHISEIQKHDSRQNLIEAFSIGLKDLEADDDPEVVLQSFNESLRRKAVATPTSRPIGELIGKVFETSRSTSEFGKPMKTGFDDLDGMLGGGICPGEFVVIAARPSNGKSAFGAQIAMNIAQRVGPVLFVSLEMGATDIARRIVAGETGISFSSLRNGPIGPEAFASGLQQCGKFSKCPLYISDARRQTVQSIVSQVRQHASRAPLRAVFVDYIGLIASTDKRKQLWEHITEVSFELKSLAIAESIPVVAICQLNRDSEEEKPKLSHLRNSGAIEQDADIVILLHREKRDSEDFTVFVPKCRNGRTGKADLGFDGSRYRFIDRSLKV